MNRRGFLVGLAAGPLAVAVGGPRPAGLRATGLRLSPRERQVLALWARGWSVPQISRELFVSQHTVRTHMENILVKVEMHSSQKAAVGPLRQGR